MSQFLCDREEVPCRKYLCRGCTFIDPKHTVEPCMPMYCPYDGTRCRLIKNEPISREPQKQIDFFQKTRDYELVYTHLTSGKKIAYMWQGVRNINNKIEVGFIECDNRKDKFLKDVSLQKFIMMCEDIEAVFLIQL